ncbi:hypothetical protein SAMN05428944_6699 [Streptomyces sp. 1222.5]|nr:hypothetical protein BX260_1397 [Streptomyces sp. 5112.2]SED17380.1 hypothetical protein SAMN05428944_6699 [Streptomyces sp. 1222.5]
MSASASHSEADLQHSFALAVGEVAPEVRCRLEIPMRGSNASEYLDLLCLGPASRTAIEFKYVTRQWSGTAGTPPEEYALRGHNAPDVARRDFLRDVARLERFCDREDQNGLALLITNEAALWRPRQRRMPTRDEEFRDRTVQRCGHHEGHPLSCIDRDHGLDPSRVVGRGGEYPRSRVWIPEAHRLPVSAAERQQRSETRKGVGPERGRRPLDACCLVLLASERVVDAHAACRARSCGEPGLALPVEV